MELVYTPLVFPFLLAAICNGLLLAVILLHSRTSWSDPSTRTLVYVLCSALLWVITYGIYLVIEPQSASLFWFNLSHLGPSLLAPSILLHASTYTGHYRWFTRWRSGFLGIEPTLTGVLVLTDPYHDLLRRDPELIVVWSTQLVNQSAGPLWYVRVTYQYLLVAVTVVLLLLAYHRAKGPFRNQLELLLLAIIIPVVVNVLFDVQYLFDAVPIRALASVELTSAAFAVSGLLFTYSLVRHRYLAVGPIARGDVVDQLTDPFFALDRNLRLVDFNTAATSLVSNLHPDRIGDPFEDVFPELAAILDEHVGENEREGNQTQKQNHGLRASDQLTLQTDDGYDHYSVVVSKLHTGTTLRGYSISLRETTDLVASRQQLEERHEKQLKVADRVWRHNIRNALTVIQGRAELIRTTETAPSVTHAERILEKCNELLETSVKARTINELLWDAPTLQTVNASALVDRVADELRESYPEVTIDVDVPEGVWVVATKQLEHAIEELLTNAIVHNDQTIPVIEVRFVLDAELVRIEIVDNGPGIPEQDRRVIEGSRDIDAQTHASGLGLWLVYWIVRQSDGEIWFEQSDPRGSVVVLELERGHPG